MLTRRGSLAVVAALVAGAGVSTARPAASQQSVSVVISRYETARAAWPRNQPAVIVAWYARHPELRPVVHPGRGRGRGRGGGYPPGWEKQVRKHGVLPATLRTYYAPAPRGLVRTLPRLPRGYEYAVIGNRVVVLEPRNWLVLDVLAVL